jgi:hypothetical protein
MRGALARQKKRLIDWIYTLPAPPIIRALVEMSYGSYGISHAMTARTWAPGSPITRYFFPCSMHYIYRRHVR